MSNKNAKNFSASAAAAPAPASPAAEQNSAELTSTTAGAQGAAEQEQSTAGEQSEQVTTQDQGQQDNSLGEVTQATQEAPSDAITGVIVGRPGGTPAASVPPVRTAPERIVPSDVPGVGVVSSTAAGVGVDALGEKLEKILADVPAASRSDIVRLRIYCQTMAPGKPVAEKVGAMEQAALYRLIQNIINRQEQYFSPLFTALLAVFGHDRNGALGDRHRNRFMQHVVLSKSDREAFQAISHMLFLLADPKSRGLALKQVNLEKALASGLTADGQRRVLQYFNA